MIRKTLSLREASSELELAGVALQFSTIRPVSVMVYGESISKWAYMLVELGGCLRYLGK